MKKSLVLLIVIISLGVSITTISAQSQYSIPSWVKGIAGFWSEGKISDSEFGEGLTFLINSGIIEVPHIKQLESKIEQLEEENDDLRKELLEAYDLPEWYGDKVTTSDCDTAYPDVCIIPYPPDLDCGEIGYSNFRVLPPDPHGFDRDGDGIGCES